MNVQLSVLPTVVTFFSEEQEKPIHEHCPLCVYSLVHPSGDSRPPTIIFLDMEGVLVGKQFTPLLANNIDKAASQLFPQVAVEDISDYQRTVAKGKHLDRKALMALEVLTQRIEAAGQRPLIVLSSIWRNDATLQQQREEVFAGYKFSKYLCGKTAPDSLATRWTPECKQGFNFGAGAKKTFGNNLESEADTIEFWLQDHGFPLDSTNFLVINHSTSPDLEKFQRRFMRIYELFCVTHAVWAAKVLKV